MCEFKPQDVPIPSFPDKPEFYPVEQSQFLNLTLVEFLQYYERWPGQ